MILASQFKADVNLGNLVRQNLMGANEEEEDEDTLLMNNINERLNDYESLVASALNQIDSKDRALLD